MGELLHSKYIFFTLDAEQYICYNLLFKTRIYKIISVRWMQTQMCLQCRPGGSDVSLAYAEARSMKTLPRWCWSRIIYIFTFYFAAVTSIASPNTRGSCPSHHTPPANILERAAEVCQRMSHQIECVSHSEQQG